MVGRVLSRLDTPRSLLPSVRAHCLAQRSFRAPSGPFTAAASVGSNTLYPGCRQLSQHLACTSLARIAILRLPPGSRQALAGSCRSTPLGSGQLLGKIL